MKIIIGCDHSALQLKNDVAAFLQAQGHFVKDIGTYTAENVHYPEYAKKVALGVSTGEFDRGVMVDGVGSASAVVCNKLPGVRAAVVFNEFSAKIMREHGDSNVMCIGAKVLDSGSACRLTALWLETKFLDKYRERVGMIGDIEKEFFRSVPRKEGLPKQTVVFGERDALKAVRENREVVLTAATVVTPAARDLIRQKKLSVKREG